MLASTLFAALALTSLDPEAAERERLRVHFDGAIELLQRNSATMELAPAQRARRAQVVDTLRVYRDRGLFPKNTGIPGYAPYFVDDVGTRCAVAYLLEESGRPDLVVDITERRNNALVHELADNTELVAWTIDHGLTLEEAVRIQPTYPCGQGWGPVATDLDGDAWVDDFDNCPFAANPDQADSDGNGYGDACDPCPGEGCDVDMDGDEVVDALDNCPDTGNPDQLDADWDQRGDACDTRHCRVLFVDDPEEACLDPAAPFVVRAVDIEGEGRRLAFFSNRIDEQISFEWDVVRAPEGAEAQIEHPAESLRGWVTATRGPVWTRPS